MDTKSVVQIYNRIMVGYKKNTLESVLMRWMNLEPIIQSEVNQKKKKKLYVNVSIGNLER